MTGANEFALRARFPGFELEAAASWDVACVALFGASGAGKSTLVEALAGARSDVTGSIVLAGRRVDRLPARARRVGWVPQDASLFPHMSVRENIEFARRAGESGAALDRDPVARAVEALEIGALLDRRASDLSGGERQRVALARALASAPAMLLLDEPLASIDRPLRSRVLPFLQRIPKELGVPIFLVTHDPLEVSALASHVLVLEAGRIVQSGEPHDVFASAAAFGSLMAIGAENRFDVSVVARGEGTALVETSGGCRLSMVSVDGFREPEAVAVRAEDIMLAQHDPGPVSAQNVFSAKVTSVRPLGRQVLVELAGEGESWSVKVTPRATEALRVEPGRSFVLLIKAHAIVPAPAAG